MTPPDLPAQREIERLREVMFDVLGIAGDESRQLRDVSLGPLVMVAIERGRLDALRSAWVAALPIIVAAPAPQAAYTEGQKLAHWERVNDCQHVVEGEIVCRACADEALSVVAPQAAPHMVPCVRCGKPTGRIGSETGAANGGDVPAVAGQVEQRATNPASGPRPGGECPVREAAERFVYHNNPDMERAARGALVDALYRPCPGAGAPDLSAWVARMRTAVEEFADAAHTAGIEVMEASDPEYQRVGERVAEAEAKVERLLNEIPTVGASPWPSEPSDEAIEIVAEAISCGGGRVPAEDYRETAIVCLRAAYRAERGTPPPSEDETLSGPPGEKA